MRPTHLDTFEVARLHDPAFAGIDAADAIKYARSRTAEDMPKPLPGLVPVIFHARRLTRSQVLDRVEQNTTDAKRYAAAFVLGVARVTGLPGGEQWEPAVPGEAISEDELDALDISPACMIDIGSVIYSKSIAPKASSPRYPAVPSSLHAWDGLDHLSAAASREGAAESSGGRSEP